MPLNLTEIQEQLEELHCDAVLWKAELLWQGATDPDKQASAMEDMVKMLVCINNETKRTAYYRQIDKSINGIADEKKKEIARISKLVAVREKNIEKLQDKKNLGEDDKLLLEANKEEKRQLDLQLTALKATAMAPLLEKDIKKQVSDELKRRKDAQEEKVRKAKFEQGIQSAEDAGLPEDFEGTKDDVYAALKYGIYVHEDVYYSRGGNKGDYPISNFTMKIIYHVDSSDDQAFRLISIKNVYGFETMININTDDFVSLGSFKKILARRGDFVFKGADTDLCRLQEFLQKDETSAKRIEILGWNNRYKFWAWSNGLTVMDERFDKLSVTEGTTGGEGFDKISLTRSTTFIPVDDYGIVEWKGKRFFIPACSMMYREKEGMFVNEKKFIYTEPIEGFAFEEWSRLMYGAYQKKSIPGILFYIGSVFRDIMMAKVRRYPLLNLFGPPGAGKGEMYDSIMHMFGFKQDQIMLGGATTVVGFMRKLAQFKNAVVGLDEYKNNLLQKVIESLKNLYDGIGYERGKMSNDFATESTPVNSSTILSGQDMPTIEPALFMRCVMLSFEEGKFSEDQRRSFQKLKNDYEHNGLSYITADLLQYRGIFEEQFKDRYLLIFKQTMKDVSNVEVDDRMIMNISIFLTVMDLTKDLKYPFTFSEAKTYLIDNMLQQHAILAGNNDVAKFWGVVEALFFRDEIREGHDFMLEDSYMYARVMQLHPLYQKEMIARRDMNYLSKSTLEYYLKLDKTMFCDYTRKRFPDGSNNWCYKMKYAKLGIDLIKVKQSTFESNDQHAINVKAKYENMGVKYDDEVVGKKVDDVPFPVANNVDMTL